MHFGELYQWQNRGRAPSVQPKQHSFDHEEASISSDVSLDDDSDMKPTRERDAEP